MFTKWTEVSRKFTPPPWQEFKADRLSEDLMYDLTFGFTTVELHSNRGKVRFVKSPGDQRNV